MARSRCRFISAMNDQLNDPIWLGTHRLSAAGNFPGFIIWPLVCQDPGRYLSLCLGTEVKRAKALKFCDWCQDTADFFRPDWIDIYDLWEEVIICDKSVPPEVDGNFPFRVLQTKEDLIKLSIEF
jgi:hypothetical protein